MIRPIADANRSSFGEFAFFVHVQMHVLPVNAAGRVLEFVDDAVESLAFRFIPIKHSDHRRLAVDAAYCEEPHFAAALEQRSKNDRGNDDDEKQEKEKKE